MTLNANTSFSQDTDDWDLSALMQPADTALFVKDANWFNWCHSVIKDGELKTLSFAVKKGNESFIVFFDVKSEK